LSSFNFRERSGLFGHLLQAEGGDLGHVIPGDVLSEISASGGDKGQVCLPAESERDASERVQRRGEQAREKGRGVLSALFCAVDGRGMLTWHSLLHCRFLDINRE
jgi:hypothetical protein